VFFSHNFSELQIVLASLGRFCYEILDFAAAQHAIVDSNVRALTDSTRHVLSVDHCVLTVLS